MKNLGFGMMRLPVLSGWSVFFYFRDSMRFYIAN